MVEGVLLAAVVRPASRRPLQGIDVQTDGFHAGRHDVDDAALTLRATAWHCQQGGQLTREDEETGHVCRKCLVESVSRHLTARRQHRHVVDQYVELSLAIDRGESPCKGQHLSWSAHVDAMDHDAAPQPAPVGGQLVVDLGLERLGDVLARLQVATGDVHLQAATRQALSHLQANPRGASGDDGDHLPALRAGLYGLVGMPGAPPAEEHPVAHGARQPRVGGVAEVEGQGEGVEPRWHHCGDVEADGLADEPRGEPPDTGAPVGVVDAAQDRDAAEQRCEGPLVDVGCDLGGGFVHDHVSGLHDGEGQRDEAECVPHLGLEQHRRGRRQGILGGRQERRLAYKFHFAEERPQRQELAPHVVDA
mmetsp:Transcript_47058/g.117380  ORF Transcript_47058/g.117380 Transcript_47058/m.117380 type:complete len:363 (+) Transcript_47058:419-1507(+)